jgi:hypothetical protein
MSRASDRELLRLLFVNKLGKLLDQTWRQVVQHPALQKGLHVRGHVVVQTMHQRLDLEVGGVGEYVTSIADRKMLENNI